MNSTNQTLVLRLWIATATLSVLVVAAYLETFQSIVGIWLSTDTYLHGAIVIPVSVFLIWRKRSEIRRLPISPHLGGLVLLFGLVVAWAFFDLLGIQIGKHFSVVAMFPTLVLLIWGRRVFRLILFPLCYVVFAVPFGEALIPHLIDITATIVVQALEVSGVPVLREGRYLIIPDASIEVAKSCSGLRFLFATVALSALIGYLEFNSYAKRALLIVAAIALSISANGFRAYLIVFIAHLSDMRLGFGADHLWYGRILFALVMITVIWIGVRFSDKLAKEDDKTELARIPAEDAPLPGIGREATVMAIAIVCVLAGPMSMALMTNTADRVAAVTADMRVQVSEWNRTDHDPASWRPSFIGWSRMLLSRFDRVGDSVDVAIVQYDSHAQGAELSSAMNQLVDVGTGWVVGNSTAFEYAGPGLSNGPVVILETQAVRDGELRLLWYWYDISGRHASSDLSVKMLEVWAAVSGQFGYSSAIVLSTAGTNNVATGRKILGDFLRVSYAPISSCLNNGMPRNPCIETTVSNREVE